jgi:16S rRNA (adenine1518-N6/adenine1519-N6)-dimethyltransferase
MLQRETAERLSGKPRTKAYGGLSVFVQACMEVRLEFNLGGGHFYPPPEVASTVLSLARRKPLPLPEAEDRRKFNAFVRQGFSQRRKKLRNVLPVDLDKRPEELAVEEWLELYDKTGRHL